MPGIESEWRKAIEEERALKDEFMARHTESPFVAERVPFHPLNYFPVDAKYRLPGRLERRATPEEAFLRTNRDGSAVMRYLGDLVFSLEGHRHRLRVYHAGEGVGTSVFVPFRDLTSGKESYGPGRYLVFTLTEDDRYDVDFNAAFNPYCAYTDAYECGFPPAENDLPIAIRAGEKAWLKDSNPSSPSGAILAMTRRQLATRARAPPPPRTAPKSSPKTRVRRATAPAKRRARG
ncbi:protein containing DUF1684 [mine drainage metagenome]|uniref:Protein containing DUF1684 n=1 Tax=mine drainage metagenome TaxID=410659 RepID=T1CSP4_9ZZZZ